MHAARYVRDVGVGALCKETSRKHVVFAGADYPSASLKGLFVCIKRWSLWQHRPHLNVGSYFEMAYGRCCAAIVFQPNTNFVIKFKSRDFYVRAFEDIERL